MTKGQTVLAAIITVVATVLLNTVIVQACWNYFVPAVLSLPQISFFQAMVLAILVRSLRGANDVSFTKKES